MTIEIGGELALSSNASVISETMARQTAIDELAQELQAVSPNAWKELIDGKVSLYDVLLDTTDLVQLLNQFPVTQWSDLIAALEAYDSIPGDFIKTTVHPVILFRSIRFEHWPALIAAISEAGLANLFDSPQAIADMSKIDEEIHISSIKLAILMINMLPADIISRALQPTEDEHIFDNIYILLESIPEAYRLLLLERLGTALPVEQNLHCAAYIQHVISEMSDADRTSKHIAVLLILLSAEDKIKFLQALGNGNLENGIRYLVTQFPIQNHSDLALWLYGIDPSCYPILHQVLSAQNLLETVQANVSSIDDQAINEHLASLFQLFFSEANDHVSEDNISATDASDDSDDNSSCSSLSMDDDDDAMGHGTEAGVYHRYKREHDDHDEASPSQRRRLNPQ